MKVTDEMVRVAARIYRTEYDYGVMSREGAMEKVLQAVLDQIEGRVIAALDAIDSGDPEKAHGDAEVAIIGVFGNQESESFSNKVSKAWDRAADRVGGFWYA